MTVESQLSLVGDLAADVSEVVTDELSRLAASTDRSGSVADGLPLAVVRAHSVADVRATMRIASAHRVPVVPRGAGTGLAGGAHGVGRLKRTWLEPELGADSINVQQRIKAALDLLGILNPGVGF
ncbi:FAD-linked oxidase C-terminal domain-containing protein [Nocardioides sp. NPDC051685]|uniref:FAD-linked oxidase C-terminal domain-containing protein n=1 Tax=Nocardioides sp. NPDC051685 TaxID=3364334 RepID=UPI0037A60A6C